MDMEDKEVLSNEPVDGGTTSGNATMAEPIAESVEVSPEETSEETSDSEAE